jgi:metallo-beta-lactamase family protein
VGYGKFSTGLPALNRPQNRRFCMIDKAGRNQNGDKQELLRFIKESNLNIKRIAVVHGEEDQALAFAGHLRQTGYPVLVPKRGETIRL